MKRVLTITIGEIEGVPPWRIDCDYLLANLEGCLEKLENARDGRFGETWDHSGRDVLDPLLTYTAQVRNIVAELQHRGILESRA